MFFPPVEGKSNEKLHRGCVNGKQLLEDTNKKRSICDGPLKQAGSSVLKSTPVVRLPLKHWPRSTEKVKLGLALKHGSVKNGLANGHLS